jgi:hypothetical protein
MQLYGDWHTEHAQTNGTKNWLDVLRNLPHANFVMAD